MASSIHERKQMLIALFYLIGTIAIILVACIGAWACEKLTNGNLKD